jgi:ubiquinone/menaquinone biosynthesis C-methylase UbiE
MKTIFRFILLLYFTNISSTFSQNYFGEFSKTEFKCEPEDLNFFLYLFETKDQLRNFIDLKKGDIVTEIGAGDGINIGVLSMVFDSLTFVAQDIDTKVLNSKTFNKTIKKYTKYRQTPQTNKFETVIGTMTSTNLPDNKFDELFIINSFHDFDKQDEMLDDIYKKLKPNGRFILLEGFSFPNDTQICPDYGPHILHTLDAELPRFEKHGFYLTKMRAPNCNAAHYGNALIFEKDKNESLKFYKAKIDIDELVNHTFRLKQNDIASDSGVVKQIIDSIQPNIKSIVNVYRGYELWMREIGIKHLMKSHFSAAINVLKGNVELFPLSYQTNYWLGVAYEKNKQYDMSLKYYNNSLKLNPTNTICLNKIKTVDKLKNTNR